MTGPAPSPPPEWHEVANTWPLSEHSRFVRAGAHIWHVQTRPGSTSTSASPTLLMLHGTGASGHSFAGLARALPAEWGFIIPDLPGHGFTRPAGPFRPSLSAMASEVAALLQALAATPSILLGHSAGAAIALTLAPTLPTPPARIISLNGALRPFDGAAGFLFPAIARLMSLNPLLPPALAASARDRTRVERLLTQTGGALPPEESVACYALLMRQSRHIAGALAMMAHWDLTRMEASLAHLAPPVTLLAGALDRAVPPGDAARLAARNPNASAILLPGLGHLAHEQDPNAVLNALFA